MCGRIPRLLQLPIDNATGLSTSPAGISLIFNVITRMKTAKKLPRTRLPTRYFTHPSTILKQPIFRRFSYSTSSQQPPWILIIPTGRTGGQGLGAAPWRGATVIGRRGQQVPAACSAVPRRPWICAANNLETEGLPVSVCSCRDDTLRSVTTDARLSQLSASSVHDSNNDHCRECTDERF